MKSLIRFSICFVLAQACNQYIKGGTCVEIKCVYIENIWGSYSCIHKHKIDDSVKKIYRTLLRCESLFFRIQKENGEKYDVHLKVVTNHSLTPTSSNSEVTEANMGFSHNVDSFTSSTWTFLFISIFVFQWSTFLTLRSHPLHQILKWLMESFYQFKTSEPSCEWEGWWLFYEHNTSSP